MTQGISLTDLTDALQGPDRERVIHDVRAQLHQLAHRVDEDIAHGANPVEFERQKKIRDAVRCSSDIFEAHIKK